MKKVIIIYTAIILSAYLGLAQNPGDYLFSTSSIHTVKIYFSQSGWYDSLIAYKPLDIKMLGKVEIDGYLVDSVGIQFKGNSSFNIPSKKKSWKIDFNEFKSSQKFDGVKVINLNNCFKDPTFLREKIALDFCNKNGISAPRCSYANVYVNDTLWGFYTLVEQVNTTFLNTVFSENDGNLFKGDPQGTLQWYGSSPSSYYTKYELKTNETVNDWTDLVRLIDKINNTPSNQFYDSLEAVLNTTSVIKAWAFSILFVNLDSYQGSGHNYYIYHNLMSNKFEWIIWDVNEAFGNFNQGMNINQLENLSIFYIPNPPGSRPLTDKMLQNSSYKNSYIWELCNLVYSDFDTTYLYRRIDSIADIIRPYVYADTQKLYTNTQFESNINSNVAIGMFNVPGLKSFILNRRNSLVSQLAANGCLMSTQETVKPEKIHLYPNPCKDKMYLMLSSDDLSGTGFTVDIYNIVGEKVKSILIDKSLTQEPYIIDTKELNSGLYLCTIHSDSQEQYTFKVLIMR